MASGFAMRAGLLVFSSAYIFMLDRPWHFLQVGYNYVYFCNLVSIVYYRSPS